jgi:hypothetical protein
MRTGAIMAPYGLKRKANSQDKEQSSRTDRRRKSFREPEYMIRRESQKSANLLRLVRFAKEGSSSG